MPEYHQAVYVISVAAELAGMHPQTLRIYERKGLVAPARTGGNSRRYSQADIDQLRRIQELPNEGLRVLQLEAEVEQLRREIDRIREAADQAVAETHKQYRRDLVPLRQEIVLYQGQRRRRR